MAALGWFSRDRLLLLALACLAAACGGSGQTAPAQATQASTGQRIEEPVAAEEPAFLVELGITFVYPESWQQRTALTAPEPAYAFGVTPDRSSGNWMGIILIPSEAIEQFQASEEDFLASLPGFAERGITVTAPREIELAGLRGLEVTLSDIPGDRTGTLHGGAIIVLFGEAGTYRVQAQYDEENRANVLDAWGAMLDSLVLPDRP